MKQYLPRIPLLTLTAGSIGIALRFWLLLIGEDEKGLYPAPHISRVLLLLLTAGVLIGLFLTAAHAGKNRSYSTNFPASALGALGYLFAGIFMLYSGSQHFSQGNLILYPITAVAGLVSGAVLLPGAWFRFRGKRPPYVILAIPCMYFCLRLFCMGHTWGDEPEIDRFLFAFLATAASIPALYQLWAFSVGLGKRATCLLCSLIAVYLCLVAVPGDREGLFYLAMAVFFFLNLCPAKPSPRRAAPAPAVETPPVNAPEDMLPEQRDAEIDALIAELMLQTEDFKE